MGGNSTPDGILQLEGEGQFLPCLGTHEAHPKNYFVWGCFPKIEWAPADVDPGGAGEEQTEEAALSESDLDEDHLDASLRSPWGIYL